MYFLKQISYSSIRSFDPAVPVAGPPQTVSNLWNSTHHVFMHLHPGTTYQFFIRASTVKGFGPATAINVTTNISGMQMNKLQIGLIMALVCNGTSWRITYKPSVVHLDCQTFNIVMHNWKHWKELFEYELCVQTKTHLK